MHATIQQLLTEGVIVTDGAWGTQLQARGLAVGEFPDAWNLLHPRRVAEVARAYVLAGSRVILTNTFGSNRIRLREAHLDDKVEEINRRGAEISKRAAGKRALVFASIGPSGKMLLTGETSYEELRDAFAEQARALAAGGADGLVVETMADTNEARAAVNAARMTGLPVVACMVFDSGKDKDRTIMGATPEQAATALAGAGADVIGANCGQGIAGFIPICKRLRAATDRPVWIKANAGLPKIEGDHAVYATTAKQFAGYVPELISAGATFIGGCCGTTPEFIRAIVQATKATEVRA